MKKFGRFWVSAGLCAGWAAQAHGEIVVTPRAAGYFDNSSQRQSGIDNVSTSSQSNDVQFAEVNRLLREEFGPDSGIAFSDFQGAGKAQQAFFPMYGGSVTYVFGGERRTQITATAMYGTTSDSISSVQTATQTTRAAGFEAQDIYSTISTGRARFARFDAELTAQRRIDETFSIMGGFRYERIRTRATITSATMFTQNGSNLIRLLRGDGDLDLGFASGASLARYRSVGEIYSVRIGGAAYIPVGERRQVYVNGLLHLNHEPGETIRSLLSFPPATATQTTVTRIRSETTVGPDISVGFVQRLGGKASIDLRYRGLFYFPVSGPRKFDDPRVNHGLSIGLSITL